MTDINTVTVAGRLTRDAELTYTSAGTAICNFSIASNYYPGPEKGKQVNYFDCAMFGKRATSLQHYLLKGKQVAVSGELRQDRWEKDGAKHSRVKIMVSNIQLFGGKSETALKAEPAEPADEFEDDIPF